MTTVQDMIQLLWQPRRVDIEVRRRYGLDRKLPENFKYYGHWGFSIYRTYYSPESDQHWDMLLDALKRQTYLALAYLDDEGLYKEDMERNSRGYWCHECCKNKDEYTEDLKRLKKLFHLDLREDPLLLDGLDIRQLREVCLQEQSKAEETMAGRTFGYVLVADEAVLKDIARGEFVIKAVAYDWETRESSWGWMRIPTGYLLEFWHSLMIEYDHPHRALRFNGPEDHLERYIWPGEDAAHPTSECSEIRYRGFHYSAQTLRY